MVVEPNVGLEMTKGVCKVVVQELHVQGRCRELERPGPIDWTPCARNIGAGEL